MASSGGFGVAIFLVLLWAASASARPGHASKANMRNVAPNGTCYQSSIHRSGHMPSGNNCTEAINGNTRTTYTPGNCIHTAIEYPHSGPFWQVTLDKEYNIRLISVYGREDGYRETSLKRLTHVKVRIDGQEVYSFSGTETPLVPTEIWEGLPVSGRTVTLSRKNEQDSFLNLCEVQIWDCKEGKRGEDCTDDCGHCAGAQACNSINGSCPGGCQQGWKGPLCTECVEGKHGEDCTDDCGHCAGNQACNSITGSCPGGCQQGWKGPLCTEHVVAHHDVTCGQTEMSFSISRDDLKFVPQNVTLSDPRCHVDITASHLTGRIPLNECGTSLRLTNDSLVFSNFLLFPPAPAEDNDNITSNIERIIPLECRYSRISDLRLSYLPMVRQILFTETGVGQFQFRIDQFHDGSFTSKMADSAYPVKVTSSERVFLQLSLGQWVLKGKDGYGMEVERCVASPSPSMMAIHNDSSDELIRDSCPVKPDVQLINSQSEQAMQNASELPQEFRFSFKPTIVTNSSDSAKAPSMRLMYIHCRVRLCAEDACHSSAECAPPEPNNMKRRKRSVGEWGYSERRPVGYHLSTGPFVIAGDDADAPRSSPADLTSPLVVAFGALAGTTTLIALGVIAAWTFSRRRGERYEVNHVTIRQQ